MDQQQIDNLLANLAAVPFPRQNFIDLVPHLIEAACEVLGARLVGGIEVPPICGDRALKDAVEEVIHQVKDHHYVARYV